MMRLSMVYPIKKRPWGRWLLAGSIVAVLLAGWWTLPLVFLCACAAWRLDRPHKLAGLDFDAIGSSSVGQVPGRNFEPDPSCWSVALRERIVDARPPRNGGRSSWTCEETSNAVD